jgi:hypothetical protein
VLRPARRCSVQRTRVVSQPCAATNESDWAEMPIADDARLAEGVQLFQPDLVNLYGCAIGSQTKICAFVEIQKNRVLCARQEREGVR